MDASNTVADELVEYDNSLEGELQFLVDKSLYYSQKRKEAKTLVAKDLYNRKLLKNNKKMHRMLFRTPNAFNPLLPILNGETTTDMSYPPGETPEGEE